MGRAQLNRERAGQEQPYRGEPRECQIEREQKRGREGKGRDEIEQEGVARVGHEEVKEGEGQKEDQAEVNAEAAELLEPVEEAGSGGLGSDRDGN